METNTDPAEDPLVLQYFHLSHELAAYIDDLVDNRGAVRRDADGMVDAIRTCAGCQYFQSGRCGVCGCGLNLRVRIASLHCPLAKW